MKIQNLLSFICFGFVWLAFLPRSEAYFSTFDTADLIPQKTYRLGLEPQVIVTRNAGVNVIAHFDMGADESSNLRFLVGSGIVAFQAGAFYKLQLFPDYENQPAVSLQGGLLYGSVSGVSNLNFRIHPMVSKLFKTETAGDWTPFAALPFGITGANGSSVWPIQLALGTKWFPPGMRRMSFIAELGFELNAAFNYVSAGFVVPFESFDKLTFD